MTSPEAEQALAGLLARAALAPGAVVLVDSDPSAPAPQEGPWVVVKAGAQHVVGAMGRGKFAPYEGLWTPSDAVDLAIRLASSPLPYRAAQPSAGELDSGRATAQGILDRTDARGGQAGPAGLEVGELLDVIGPETGHHLYALGTPFPARSQPPSDVGAPYFTFRVAQPLPATVLEGRAAPWFEQPGGGAMVVLDRPIRWYVDNGYLGLTL